MINNLFSYQQQTQGHRAEDHAAYDTGDLRRIEIALMSVQLSGISVKTNTDSEELTSSPVVQMENGNHEDYPVVQKVSACLN